LFWKKTQKFKKPLQVDRLLGLKGRSFILLGTHVLAATIQFATSAPPIAGLAWKSAKRRTMLGACIAPIRLDTAPQIANPGESQTQDTEKKTQQRFKSGEKIITKKIARQ
jgi:hypothetical protein